MNKASFSLRTLLLAVLIVAGAAVIWQQARHNSRLQEIVDAHQLSESGQFDARQFRVAINELSAPIPGIYEIVIETIGEPDISVDSARNHSSIMNQTLDTGLVRSRVLVVVDRVHWLEGPDVAYRLLISISDARGARVGGPAGYTLPRETEIDDVFELLIKPGAYPRGKPTPLLRFNDETTELLIQ